MASSRQIAFKLKSLLFIYSFLTLVGSTVPYIWHCCWFQAFTNLSVTNSAPSSPLPCSSWRTKGRLSCNVKGPVKGHQALFRETSSSTFFTMLTFSQILNIYLQWMTALRPVIVCMVKSDRPNYAKSSCQYNHDMAPSCTRIIPYKRSIMAQFSCQSPYNLGRSQWGTEERFKFRWFPNMGYMCPTCVNKCTFIAQASFSGPYLLTTTNGWLHVRERRRRRGCFVLVV